jgi:hypothetical protein
MRLIYFAPVQASSYPRRAHFTVRAWLERGVREVLWINPYPVRLPGPRDVLGLLDSWSEDEPVSAEVTVIDVPALPIEPLPAGSWLNRRFLWSDAWRRLAAAVSDGAAIMGIGWPSALALAALRELRPAASFYEAIADFPEFYAGLSRRSVRRLEDAIAAKTDLVVTSSTHLAEKFARSGLRVVKAPNACAADALPAWRPPEHERLVLGYIGSLDAWFDWPLVTRLAAAMPYVTIDVVGPRLSPVPWRLPANVRLLGPCRHHEAARHLARFSAGLIPFQRTPLTAGFDPIEFYEYRAFGLPVLSTTFGEMALRGQADSVVFLDQGQSPTAIVAKALSHSADPAEVADFRRKNDWRRRYVDPDPFAALFNRPPLRRAA